MNSSIMKNVKETQEKKQDFKSVEQMAVDNASKLVRGADNVVKKAIEANTESMIEKANAALSNTGANADLKEFEDLQKISDEDLELAEQTIFKGYAEYNIKIKNLPNHTFTLCTTSAEDVSIIDEVLYDMVKEKEDKDGQVDLPDKHVQSMRSALYLAFGFKGSDGKDFCDEPVNQLMAIKRAVIKVKELEFAGELDKAQSLLQSLKKSVRYRAVRMKRYPTPVIDFLSNKKFEFDSRMYTILMSDKLLPKSSDQPQATQDLSSSTQGGSSDTAQ